MKILASLRDILILTFTDPLNSLVHNYMKAHRSAEHIKYISDITVTMTICLFTFFLIE